ncbi:uncharacterized protein LOC120319613 [Crotalus tigris]|uniref:uncharacterized protein LOC120319613 n=1 Tax=Crotalus tigris TaxID=88082 RepID=UPI00192FA7E9|nr:uncharacterized protein LOC120319613 [Crotalus tigris]XP_039224600.1 uncharacterized protein LOC120319613 [Crotalus tigris]
MLKRFCESEWTTFGVGWPKEGSVNPELVARVHQIVTRSGHWDQYPYIDQWQINIAEKPLWLAKCQIECAKIYLANQKAKPQTKAKILSQEDREEVARPPPYVPRREEGRIHQQILPPPVERNEGPLQPEAGVERKIKEDKTVQKKEQDLNSKISVSSGTRSKIGVKTEEMIAPLREVLVPGPNNTNIPMLQYVPFTTTDLFNWHQQFGPFSEKPQEIIDLFSTIIQTHNLTWDDMQQLISTLLDMEGREKYRLWKLKVLARRHPEGEANSQASRNTDAVEERPNWNANDTQHQTLLHNYRLLCSEAQREAAIRPVNYAAVTSIWQEKYESPTAFLSRLIETYKINTGLDMEMAQNRPLLIERYITQSAPDIRKKLQRTEGALGKNVAEIMEIAQKVFHICEKEEEHKSDQKEKKKVEMLAAALGGTCIGPNQCAICKQEGMANLGDNLTSMKEDEEEDLEGLSREVTGEEGVQPIPVR